jgi:hypothetical protein
MLGKARALKRYSRRQMGKVGGSGGGGGDGGGGDGGGCSKWLMVLMVYFGISYGIACYIFCRDMSRNCRHDGTEVFLVAILLACIILFCWWAIDFIVSRRKKSINLILDSQQNKFLRKQHNLVVKSL